MKEMGKILFLRENISSYVLNVFIKNDHVPK